jgi:hypothetical protein
MPASAAEDSVLVLLIWPRACLLAALAGTMSQAKILCSRSKLPPPHFQRSEAEQDAQSARPFPLPASMVKRSRVPQGMEQIDIVELNLPDPDLACPTIATC